LMSAPQIVRCRKALHRGTGDVGGDSLPVTESLADGLLWYRGRHLGRRIQSSSSNGLVNADIGHRDASNGQGTPLGQPESQHNSNICAFRQRFRAGTKMLFECERRSGKIEIGNGQKEGEYSLTFVVHLDSPADRFRPVTIVLRQRPRYWCCCAAQPLD
jgi:hypothetical protein